MKIHEIVNALDVHERNREILERCLNPHTKELRATKPKDDGEAAYVWRMLAFSLSTNPKHHHMPVMAKFDLPGHYFDAGAHEARQQRVGELNRLAAIVVDRVPVQEQPGTRRWAGAFGVKTEPTGGMGV